MKFQLGLAAVNAGFAALFFALDGLWQLNAGIAVACLWLALMFWRWGA